MGAYPAALYLLTGVCIALMAAFTLIWCVAYAVSAWWERHRRHRTAPRPPHEPPAMQVGRPRRYSRPPPYRPVGKSQREDRRRS